MFRTKKLFNAAAILGLLNTIATFGVAALTDFATPLVVGAVIWLVLTVGFKANMRWMAYFAFILALVSGVYFYANSAIAPVWASMTIVVLNVLLSVVLFILLWKRPSRARSSHSR